MQIPSDTLSSVSAIRQKIITFIMSPHPRSVVMQNIYLILKQNCKMLQH